MQKKHIIFDINGLDLGQQLAYDTSAKFALNNLDCKITLIGDLSKIKINNTIENLNLINNSLKFSDPRNLRESLKEETSMNQAVKMIVNNQADGIISGGDSGNYVSSLLFKAKRLEGISRPAFMPIVTSIHDTKTLFLDVGANLEVKTETLIEWANLANKFYKNIFGINKPKVALLNIGTEDYKGFEFVREANEILKNQTELNYTGFLEPRDILSGKADIVVIDGYGGNLILKSYEGAISTFFNILKDTIKSSLLTKIVGLILKKKLKSKVKSLDYKSAGSAWVIGVNALALKIHGSSDEVAILSALNSMKDAISKDLLNKLKEN
ncbi:phosphate acyltransferase PlsX [Mycoplasma leonicaptivi]|uniref:phosphate acyltransferase PlsX n=1 Tax=Mycoplasma leonicaptivi TaxID=36742 RepID=UPI00048075A7|nr:phosphate acyltransferase PlsX [Mycoplasma leonicaptivi]